MRDEEGGSNGTSTLYSSLFTRLSRSVELGVLLLIAAIVIHTWLVAGLLAPIVVQGDSMLPTLVPGQHLLVDRSAFTWSHPRRGQLVVLCCPEAESSYCIKRIVGLPGELVEIYEGQLWIDGQPAPSAGGPSYEFAPVGQPAQYRLAEGEYFLLGDNLAVSVDSRTWQPPGASSKLFMGSILYPHG